ncbi:MAG: energy-coupling factor transporter transmembrane component T family protein [Alphaproteobacteria bacterium]
MRYSSAKFLQTSYIKGDSFLHRIRAGKKLALVMLFGLFIYICPWPIIGQIAGWLIFLGLLYFSHLPLDTIWGYMRPFLIFLVYITVMFMIFQPWQQALYYGLRILLLLAYSALFVLTTSMQEMQDLLYYLFRFTRYIGLNPEYVAMCFTLTIRAIPLMAGQFEDIVDARKARGLKARRFMVIIPAFIASFCLARSLSEALDARGWGVPKE